MRSLRITPPASHTDACTGDADCTPADGIQWDQPPGWAVSEAMDNLDADVPWCRIHQIAWELSEDENEPEAV